MPNPGPVPEYPSDRLIGIELEFDAAGAAAKFPERMPNGWRKQTDGSLGNGYELVLDPPVALRNVTSSVVELSAKLDELGTYASKRGGFHVHVQVADYNHQKCANLANLYTHFQPVIDQLVAKSRVGNTFCPPYTENVTVSQLVNMFSLNTLVSSRAAARSARRYSVANFAMCRCENPTLRTVEFRQGSTSKRVDCIIGWAAFLVALTDLAASEETFRAVVQMGRNLDGLKGAMRFTEELHGAQHLESWVEWRHNYINEAATDAMVEEAANLMGRKPHGMFFLSRKMNINNALAQRILERGQRTGIFQQIGNKYRSSFAAQAGEDLAAVVAAMTAREATEREAAQATAAREAQLVELAQVSAPVVSNSTNPAGA